MNQTGQDQSPPSQWSAALKSPALCPHPPSSGNGPSGICLSYLLSGYTPYVKPDAEHPHPLLQRKLAEAPGVSILDQVGQSSGHRAGDTPPPPSQGTGAKIERCIC